MTGLYINADSLISHHNKKKKGVTGDIAPVYINADSLIAHHNGNVPLVTTVSDKYSNMTSKDIEKEISVIENDKKKYEEQNKSKTFNILSKIGSAIIEGSSTNIFDERTRNANQDIALSVRQKATENINTIDSYTNQLEQLSLVRKEKATTEMLEKLSNKQLQMIDGIVDVEEHTDTTHLSGMATGNNDAYSKALVERANVYNTTRKELFDQLKKQNADMTDDEIMETIGNMVELRKNQRNAQTQARYSQDMKSLAKEDPVSAFILARGSSLVGGMTGLTELYYQRGNEYGLDTNAAGFALTNNANVIDKQVQLDHDWIIHTEAFGDIDGFDLMYNAGTGIVDNLGRFALSGGNTAASGALMFTQVTNQAIITGKQKGYSDSKALTMGVLEGTFEALSEKISLDLILKDSGNVLKQVAKSFVVEGAEETTSNWLNRIADEVANGNYSQMSQLYQKCLDDGMTEAQAMSEVVASVVGEDLESFIIGGISGAIMGGGVSVNNAVSDKVGNRLSENEKMVVDKEVENRIAERETDGIKLSAADKRNIRKDVLNQLEKGYISTDTIESVLGGKTYETYKSSIDREESLKNEIKELQGNPSASAQKRLSEAKAELSELENNSAKTKLKDQLTQEVQELTKNDRLFESYNERTRKTQAFEADLTQYDTKAQETVKKAVESGILNNSNRTHEFVDLIAKLSADKGVSFDFTNNENLKTSGFALEGRTINGLVHGNDVILNIDSNKALNTVVGHEITHVLEGTELYTELQNAVVEYAKSKGDYDTRYKAVESLYTKKDENGNIIEKLGDIDAELTADLVGDYLFTDNDFINSLSTEKPSVFKKIYDEIKYMFKIATAGSKEARELEKVKRAFDKVYKEDIKADNDRKIKYSLGKIVDKNNNSYGIGVHLDSTLLDGFSSDERVELIKEYVKELGGKVFSAYDTNGNAVDVTIATSKRFENRNGRKVPANKDLKTKYINNETKQEAITLIDELVLAAKHDSDKKANYSHGWLDNNGQNDWEYWKTYIQDKNNTIWEATLNVANSINGEKILYDINPIKKVGQSVKSDTSPTKNSLSQNSENTSGNIRFSLSEDSNGKQLSKEQQEYFKDSKVRDENGALKPVYHGTKNDFTVFDINKNKVITFGNGFYFGENQDAVNTHYAGENGRVMKTYLNITNPFVIEQKQLKDIDSVPNVVMEVLGIENVTKDSIMQDLRTQGYDGIHYKNGIKGNDVFVAFEPSQIKSVENTNPTSNPDINLSLSNNNDIAPIGNNVYGKDIALESALAPTEQLRDTTKMMEKNTDVLGNLRKYTLDEEQSILKGQNRVVLKTKEDIDNFVEKTILEDERATFGYLGVVTPETIDKIRSEITDISEENKNALLKRDAYSLRIRQSEIKHLQKFGMSLDEVKDYVEKIPQIVTEFDSARYTIENHNGSIIQGIRFEKTFSDGQMYSYLMVSNKKGTLTMKTTYMSKNDYKKKKHSLLPDTHSANGYTSETRSSSASTNIIPSISENTTGNSEKNYGENLVEGDIGPVNERVDVTIPQESNSTKLNAIQTELENNRVLREECYSEYNEEIKRLQEEYDSKKNKNTKVAQNLLRRIERMKRLRDSVDADYSKRINDLETKERLTREGKPTTRQELHNKIVDGMKFEFSKKGYDLDEVLKNAKNLSTFSTVDNTPQRVMEKALGYKEGQALSDLTVNKVAQNETEGIKWLNSFTDRKNGLLAQISKQYNIKAGSKESAVAQMYAEGFYVNEKNEIIKYGDEELAKDFPDVKIQDNIKGLAKDERIRQIYDETLKMINESRTRNAYPEISRLNNYFLHFRAMDDTFSRLGLPFNPNDIRVKDLPTDLNGETADLKPGQPYFASAMHRTGQRTSFDLLGGLERYLTSAKNQIYHIDDIQTLRALRNYIADTYGQANGLEGLDALSEEEVQDRIEKVYGSHLSTFAKFLNEEANIIAGKTALIDRGLEGIIGRRGIAFLDTLNKQVGSNMVGMNVSSSLTNFLSVAQGFAKGNKSAFVKAFSQTVSNKIGSITGKSDGFAEQSPVMIRRKGAEHFYRTPVQTITDAGYTLMSAVDNLSTELIARTKYNELISKGMESQKAHYETDKWVSRIMGDRSLGQQPQLYNSKMLGLVTKFQLEVRNQLDSQFYDTIQEAKVSNEYIKDGLEKNVKIAAKVTSTLFQLAVAQHLFGKAFESVAGYNPAFDIIEVLLTAFGFDDEEESEDTVLDNIEQGFLALLEDLPYASIVTDGGRIPISSALPLTELIIGKDEYGNEKSRLETLGEIAPYYMLPTGYGQIKKTVQGLSMFSDEHPVSGSYTNSGNLRFPVEDTLGNRIQAGVFGQWASENARKYFDNDIAPLNENQIQEYVDANISIDDYWEYRKGLSGLKTLNEKGDYIGNLDIPISAKNVFINNIADRSVPIDYADYYKYKNFEEFDFATRYPEKYKVLQEQGVSVEEYKKKYEESTFIYTDDYSWAATNNEKYSISKALTDDVTQYRQWASTLNEIEADVDASGKSVSGSAKQKKVDYINGLDLDYGQKVILYRSLYDSKTDKATYNREIVEYLNERDDISYEEMVAILEALDMKVSDDGTVTW